MYVLVVLLAGASVHASVDEVPRGERAGSGGGSLVIAGGSGLPGEIFERFRALAGDPDQSVHVVVVPTASDRADREDWAETLVERWTDRGFETVTVLHTRSREEAHSTEFIAPLREADAVWFGGGRQSRLADTYLDTAFERALYELFERGGVIGGSSAGAAIMSRTMIAGGREEARVATGFDLLEGCVLDQHFSERNRQGRLRGVIEAHPALVGVGIDESTALVVRQRRGATVGEVIGEGKVHIYTRPQPEPEEEGELRETALPAGERIELPKRAAMSPSGR